MKKILLLAAVPFCGVSYRVFAGASDPGIGAIIGFGLLAIIVVWIAVAIFVIWLTPSILGRFVVAIIFALPPAYPFYSSWRYNSMFDSMKKAEEAQISGARKYRDERCAKEQRFTISEVLPPTSIIYFDTSQASVLPLLQKMPPFVPTQEMLELKERQRIAFGEVFPTLSNDEQYGVPALGIQEGDVGNAVQAASGKYYFDYVYKFSTMPSTYSRHALKSRWEVDENRAMAIN